MVTVTEAGIKTGLTPRQRVVYNSLMEYDRTAQQIAIDTGVSGNTVRPRLLELEALGLVQKSGEYRETPAGGRAAVYRVV